MFINKELEMHFLDSDVLRLPNLMKDTTYNKSNGQIERI